jgi:DNA-dependent RNA polymerase
MINNTPFYLKNMRNPITRRLQSFLPDLKFITAGIEQKKSTDYFVEDAIRKGISIKPVQPTLANAYFNENGAHYFDDEFWNKVYEKICEGSLDKVTENRRIVDKVLKSLDSIHESTKNSASNVAGIVWLSQLSLRTEVFSKALLFLFQQMLVRGSSRNITDDLSFTYTKICIDIGATLINIFISTSELLRVVLFESNNPDNTLINGLTEVIPYIFRKDLNKCKEIYKDKFALPVDHVSLEIIEIINNRIIYFVLKQYVEKNRDYSSVIEALKTFFNNNETAILQQYRLYDAAAAQNNLKLGSPIVEKLIEHKVLVKTLSREYMNKKIQTQLYVVFTEHISFSLLATEGSNKNPLCETESVPYDATDSAIRAMVQNRDSFVHNNNNTRAIVNPHNKGLDDAYKVQKTLGTRYSIDSSVLLGFLEYLKMFCGKNAKSFKSEDTLRDVYTFLRIYKIDFEGLRKSTGNSTEEIDLFESLFDFALDFNIYSDNTLSTRCKNNPRYLKIYKKVMHYKSFLIGLLNEAIIYADFKYFFNKGYVDSRGRYYQHGYYLNTQSFPMSKAFVKPFNPNNCDDVIKNNFDAFKAFIAKNLKIDRYKSLTHDAVVREDKVLKIDFLYNFFRSDKLTRQQFEQYLATKPQNLKDIIRYISNFLKKPEEFLIAASYISLECRPKQDYTNLYAYDATTSGLQMIAILLRKKSLAEQANLCGTKKADIYKRAAGSFKECTEKGFNALNKLTKLYNITGTFTKDIINTEYFIELSTKSTGDILRVFFNCDLYWSYKLPETVYLLQQRLECLDEWKVLINEQEWILSTREKNKIKDLLGHILYDVNKTVIEALFIFRNLYRFDAALNVLPGMIDILCSRETFKDPVMTYGYGATSFARTINFGNYVEDVASSKLDIYKPQNWAIKRTAHVLEMFFNNEFRLNALIASTTLREIAKVIAELKQPIIIRNKLFRIVEAPYETKTQRVKLYVAKGVCKHQVSLTIPRLEKGNLIIDRRKLENKIVPDWIHSMDATVVHYIRLYVHVFTETFKDKGFFFWSVYKS